MDLKIFVHGRYFGMSIILLLNILMLIWYFFLLDDDTGRHVAFWTYEMVFNTISLWNIWGWINGVTGCSLDSIEEEDTSQNFSSSSSV